MTEKELLALNHKEIIKYIRSVLPKCVMYEDTLYELDIKSESLSEELSDIKSVNVEYKSFVPNQNDLLYDYSLYSVFFIHPINDENIIEELINLELDFKKWCLFEKVFLIDEKIYNNHKTNG